NGGFDRHGIPIPPNVDDDQIIQVRQQHSSRITKPVSASHPHPPQPGSSGNTPNSAITEFAPEPLRRAPSPRASPNSASTRAPSSVCFDHTQVTPSENGGRSPSRLSRVRVTGCSTFYSALVCQHSVDAFVDAACDTHRLIDLAAALVLAPAHGCVVGDLFDRPIEFDTDLTRRWSGVVATSQSLLDCDRIIKQ
ncbi:hypothetical protein ACFXG4_42850, partial [Nocardia sp. NPDC059246]